MTDDASGCEAKRLDMALDRLRRSARARIDELVLAGQPVSESLFEFPREERQSKSRDEGQVRLQPTTAHGSATGSGPSAVLPPASPATPPPKVSVEVGLSKDSMTTVPVSEPFPRPGRPAQAGGSFAASSSRQGFWGRLLHSRWMGGG